MPLNSTSTPLFQSYVILSLAYTPLHKTKVSWANTTPRTSPSLHHHLPHINETSARQRPRKLPARLTEKPIERDDVIDEKSPRRCGR